MCRYKHIFICTCLRSLQSLCLLLFEIRMGCMYEVLCACVDTSTYFYVHVYVVCNLCVYCCLKYAWVACMKYCVYVCIMCACVAHINHVISKIDIRNPQIQIFSSELLVDVYYVCMYSCMYGQCVYTFLKSPWYAYTYKYCMGWLATPKACTLYLRRMFYMYENTDLAPH